MLSGIGDAVTSVLGMGTQVINAIFTESGAWSVVQPLVFIGVAMGVVGFAIKTIKSLAWGF